MTSRSPSVTDFPFMRRLRSPALAIVLFIFLVDVMSPVSVPADSMWAIPVAQSIIDRHTTNLDAYRSLVLMNYWYGIECVNGAAEVRKGPAIGNCPDGHMYNTYPVGVSVFAVPVVLGLHALLWLTRPVLMRIPWLIMKPTLRSFLSGNFVAADLIVERVVASVFIALTAGLIFLIAQSWLSTSISAFLGLLFAFATPAWSVASRMLWQHGPSMLAITATVFLLLRGATLPRLIPLAGFTCACAYAVRPSNSLWVVIISAYVLFAYPRAFWKYLLCALPVAAALLGYNYSVYHSPLSPYYKAQYSSRGGGLSGLVLNILRTGFPWSNTGRAMAGTLFSPSRGLFIFSPVFLFSAYGIFLALRRRWQLWLSICLASFTLAIWLVICFPGGWDWSGGWCYGPRMLSDLSPILILFIIPVFLQWNATQRSWHRSLLMAALLLSAAISCLVHSQGALSAQTYNWNFEPSGLSDRTWDWRDPQFLRGVRTPPYEPYIWGKVLRFGRINDDFRGAYPISGWAPPDLSFDRTEGRRATIKFRIRPSIRDKVLSAEFATGTLPCKEFPVRVSIDDQPIGDWNVVRNEGYRLLIPGRLLADRTSFFLSFAMPAATTLKPAGMSCEIRPFGLALAQLTIREASTGQNGVISVPGGGFESGRLAPWRPFLGEHPTIDTAHAHTGRASLAETGTEGSVYQDITGLEDGIPYALSAWVCASPHAAASARLGVYDSGAHAVAYSNKILPAPVWQLLTLQFVLSSKSGGVARIHLIRGTGDGTIFWDDVQVAPIPRAYVRP